LLLDGAVLRQLTVEHIVAVLSWKMNIEPLQSLRWLLVSVAEVWRILEIAFTTFFNGECFVKMKVFGMQDRQ
jgi:hypothetical protein